ncbi:MAG: methyl-accepting chemotaxis protein [Kofleriaceae bacterium]
MGTSWTFGKKLGAGFAVTVALALVIGAVGIYALRTVVTAKDEVITVQSQTVIDAERLAVASARRVIGLRGYLLTKQDSILREIADERGRFQAIVSDVRASNKTPEIARFVDDVEKREVDYKDASDRLVSLRQNETAMDVILRTFDQDVSPKRDALNDAIDRFRSHSQAATTQAKQAATDTADSAVELLLAFGAAVIVLSIIVAAMLTRTLGRQIGTAVGRVQSSSAELQAAANQQATAAKEQSTAMNEITTTITELLATSRQIAESAQRVAQIADQTAGSARGGDSTVDRAHESINAIRRQVDLIVANMLELGKKSQQIGSVLDIVAELAEQTNILAINASIEAAGAGDAGKRFSVVADEIRKLADRVGGSTKEIRTLIDDVRSSVNNTVMTTETGSKAVDAGTRQFNEVASTFKQIAGMVATTTEAAREIELSTKQQSTAVEQVNVAVTNVAQASNETEASSSQTLQTAGQLSALSRELLRMIQPPTTTRVDAA